MMMARSAICIPIAMFLMIAIVDLSAAHQSKIDMTKLSFSTQGKRVHRVGQRQVDLYENSTTDNITTGGGGSAAST